MRVQMVCREVAPPSTRSLTKWHDDNPRKEFLSIYHSCADGGFRDVHDDALYQVSAERLGRLSSCGGRVQIVSAIRQNDEAGTYEILLNLRWRVGESEYGTSKKELWRDKLKRVHHSIISGDVPGRTTSLLLL